MFVCLCNTCTCMLFVCMLNSSVYKMIVFMPVYFDNSEIQYLKVLVIKNRLTVILSVST